jgi:PPP family 3-phenylpropionic acid transporter
MVASQPNLDRRDLSLTRAYYFLLYGGVGFMSPFLSLFYVQQGLNGTQIGWATSIFALITLLAAPFWTNRNTHWRSPRGILQLFLVLTALSYLWLSQQALFWGVAIVSVFRALVSAGISPLSDSLALTVTKATQAGFGSIRVWGSFGWMICVLLSGWIVDKTGLVTSLLGAALITCLGALVLFSVQRHNFMVRVQEQQPANFRAVIDKLLHNRAMLGVAAMIIIIGVGNSGILQFEYVYLQQLGADKGLIGIAGMLSSAVEIPCMFWADRLASRLGAYPLMIAAMLIYVGLRGPVLLLPAIVTIMATRALAGFAFSFFTVGLIRFIGEQTTAHETRTVLALYTITLTNLVSIVSAPMAGVVFDHFGARILYLVAAGGYLLAWVCLNIAR